MTLVGSWALARAARTCLHRAPKYFLIAFCLSISSEAFAYTTSSIVTDPCHERITMDALRRVPSELPGAGFITPTSDEKALIADAPFDVDN